MPLPHNLSVASPSSYFSATSPPSNTLEITIGPPSSSRTWTLSIPLLTQHSTHFANLCSSPSPSPINIPTLTPRAFQNFANYIHSSIYSLNPQVPGYRAIHEHTHAWLLGQHLGAKQYKDAALRNLYTLFAPPSHIHVATAATCPIRASDVDFVCTHTAADSLLRRLFFDAVANWWTRVDVRDLAVGLVNDDDGDDTLQGVGMSWRDVCRLHPDFRDRLLRSEGVMDGWRLQLLRPVEEYLGTFVEVEEGGGEAGKAGLEESACAFVRPRLRLRLGASSFGEGSVGSWLRGEFPEAQEEGLGEVRVKSEEMAVEEDETEQVLIGEP